MKKLFLFLTIALLGLVSCENKYIASVDDLRVIRIDPAVGYEGCFINILGRNFSTAFGENHVYINGKEAKMVEYTANQLTVVAPLNDLGSYTVEVTTPLGYVASESLMFTYKKKLAKIYTVTTLAGNGTNNIKDDVGTSASVGSIEGLIWAPDGTLWFTQRSSGNAIRQFNPATSMVKTIVSGIPLPWGGDFDANGDFYFTGKTTHKIYKIARGSNSYEEVPLPIALDNPMYIKFDQEGCMWIASRDNHIVYKLKNGLVVKTYSDESYSPVALAMDSKGRMYVASSNDNRGIFMIDGDEAIRVIGSGDMPTIDNYENSLAGGPLKTNVGTIGEMCIGSDGALYYADFLTFTVVKAVPDANGDFSKGTISILAGLPFQAAILNGATDKAQFKYPSGIAISEDCKKIYVSEPTGCLLRVIDLN